MKFLRGMARLRYWFYCHGAKLVLLMMLISGLAWAALGLGLQVDVSMTTLLYLGLGFPVCCFILIFGRGHTGFLFLHGSLIFLAFYYQSIVKLDRAAMWCLMSWMYPTQVPVSGLDGGGIRSDHVWQLIGCLYLLLLSNKKLSEVYRHGNVYIHARYRREQARARHISD